MVLKDELPRLITDSNMSYVNIRESKEKKVERDGTNFHLKFFPKNFFLKVFNEILFHLTSN